MIFHFVNKGGKMPSRKDKSEVGDFINIKNYNMALEKWANIELHCRYLLPFLAIHEAARSKSEDKNKIWFWNEDNAIEKCLPILDRVIIEWKAFRAGKGRSESKKKNFWTNIHNKTENYVKELTEIFNKYNIISLKDIASLKSEDPDEIRRTIIRTIINCVSKISEVKVKKGRGAVSATLGAKTLHHFFPSVIPVYDQDVIHNDSEQKDYEEYLNNCIEGISKSRSLKQVRRKIAKDYIRTGLVPYNLIKNKRSILYRLDAKLAEYCLVGAFL
jgi:hypothetical protein